ncbi:MAG: flagellar filament capping protein FliD, partial [Rickettsiales bacterium]
SNNLNITGFSIVIDQTGGTYKATYTDAVTLATTMVDLDATAISGGGITLKGRAGTVFEGSQYVFASTADTTVNVTLSQGFGDRFYNLIDGFNNDSDGKLKTELDALADTKKRNLEQITTIDARITQYREKLVQQYAGLEAALSKANSILQLLDAQANAANNN